MCAAVERGVVLYIISNTVNMVLYIALSTTIQPTTYDITLITVMIVVIGLFRTAVIMMQI